MASLGASFAETPDGTQRPPKKDGTWEGSLTTIYNPRRQRVYNRDDNDLRFSAAAPLLLKEARRESNPINRYYAERYLLEEFQKAEGRYVVTQNFYQAASLRIPGLISEYGSFVLQARYHSNDAEGYPDASVRQLYFRYNKDDAFLNDLKVGRVLASRAAGFVNFDGGEAQIGIGGWYFTVYGGLLIDDDYLHKNKGDVCDFGSLQAACYVGGAYARDDSDNRFRAGDVRNISSKERRGDTVAAAATGYRSKTLSLELDYQKKTDERAVTEELGGLNFIWTGAGPFEAYAKGRADLLRGRAIAGLAGGAYRTDTWRINPELEYYRPNFMRGSLWEEFHAYARSTARLNLQRYIGRRLRIGARVGRVFYIEPSEEPDDITTRTMRDPITGEVVEDRTAPDVPARGPVNPLDYLYSPQLDPLTGTPRTVETRPLTFQEQVAYALLYKDPKPRNGAEGALNLKYVTESKLTIETEASTIQGVEGSLFRYEIGLGRPLGKKLYLKGAVGLAHHEDVESDEGDAQARYFEAHVRWYASASMTLSAGFEFYSDSERIADTRGLFLFKYVF